MTSWITSWLPPLPSIDLSSALPSAIQSRFISFVLKRTLGHFVKPGQFDVNQVDSQIGSGFVQVRDLRLDEDAINRLLQGIPLRLKEGSVASVMARVPWPNPMTSTIGMSVQSLQLTLSVVPGVKLKPPNSAQLAESVASVAETFIHEELSSKEEAVLRESIHSDAPGGAFPAAEEMKNIPGGFDVDVDPFHSPDAEGHEGVDRQFDPEGVGIFATLIEGLLSRFKFDARDVRITILDENNASFTLAVPDVQYTTESPESAEPSSQGGGVSRVLTVSGVTLSTRCLRPSRIRSSLYVPSTATPSPASFNSSDSSTDEETQMMMSQSLAFLPPRPPSIQVEERIPASASNPAEERQPSTPPTASPGSSLQEQMEAMEGDIILSFGSEPILMRLTTPSLRASSAQEANPPAPSASSKPRTKQSRDMKGSQKGKSQLSITLPSSPSPRPTPARTPEPGVLDQLSVEASVRGVVCIVLLSPSAFADQGASLRMEEFFSHPLVPPKGIGNYLRLHLEALSLRISSSAAKPSTKRKTTAKIKPAPSTTNATFELREISAFAYLRDNAFADDHSGYHIMPILVTDPNLPSHCTSRHSFPMAGYPFQQDADAPELPTFDIMDWTDPRHRAVSSKINTWRTKAGTRRRSGHRSSSSPGLKSLTPLSPSSSRSDGHDTQDVTSEHRPVYAVKTTATLGVDVSAVRIDIAPLHFFLDLGLFSLHIGKPGESGLLSFLSEATSFEVNSPNVEDTQDSDEEDERDWAGETTPPATPRRIADVRESERERERKRLEALRTSGAACRASRSPDIVLAVPMIRVQVRCPPTAGRTPRSGAIILDIHELELSMGPQSLHQAPTRARFAEFVDIPDDLPSHPEDNSSNEVLRAQWGRMLVSYAPVGDSKAMGILSLGPLSTPSETAFTSSAARPKHVLALLPRLRLMHSPLPSSSDASLPLHATVFAIDLPSAYVVLSKPIFDGIQLWADDITQLLENATRYWIQDADSSKATSLIGSRYFTRQGSSGAASDASPSSIVQPTRSSELVMKLSLSEGFVRIMLPRAMDQTGSPRPFDLCGSDLDLLIETKPEGKDETVMTLSVLNIGIRDLDATGEVLTMLSLTPLRDLVGIFTRDPSYISVMASPTRPMLKLRFTSATVSDRGTAKQSRVRLSLAGFTYNLLPDLQWASDLGQFAKAPPGAFDSMVPSERTQVSVRIFDGSVRLLAPTHPGAMVVHVGETEFNTDIVGGSPDIVFRLTVPELSVFMIDDNAAVVETPAVSGPSKSYWKSTGYALLCEVIDFQLRFSRVKRHVLPETEVCSSWPRFVSLIDLHSQIIIQGLDLRIHLCADTIAALTAFISDFGTLFLPPAAERFVESTRPVEHFLSCVQRDGPPQDSMDEHAFKRVPEVGAAPDMISDDLPTNPDYLDASFGAAAGFRELTDDDLDEFDEQDIPTSETPSYVTGIVSKVGGETIRMLDPEGIHIIEDYFETIAPESLDESPEIDETTLRVRADDCNVSLFLYDGYDWARTRRIIEEEMKAMKRRLARIRQLIASGQTYDPHVEETSAVLFNSVYIGLEQDLDEMEPGAIIAAIDEELKEDFENETQSSWQSLRPQAAGAPATKSTRLRHRKLTRSKGPSIEIRLASVQATVDQYGPDKGLASRTFATVKDLEILDHIKTSTWRKFLSELITDSRGNMRETDSNMVRMELCNVRPVPGNPSEEARVKAKILPLRLNVDQDALDFFKKFFSFQDQEAPKAPPPSNPDEGIYIQYAEIFPVDLKLDYKPRRVDYRALKEGKTIELMNFFHFDGAEMTLRHLTLYGITGWPRLFDMLNDLWTPDVKATQMVDIISGVSPIRSVVNVGSGVADLVLLPIAQYKKDGRVIRGVQKGTSAFVRSTAMEAIKLGARLATGTQVILEQAENVLGGQFVEPLTMEALQIPGDDEYGEPGAELLGHDEEAQDLISRYAEQPSDIKEGIQSAYKSLRRNFSSAAQTILAVPMEVYERSGNEGPVRAVIRAVPIAVLKPMIGASEAVSKTLLGLQNTLDPSVRQEAEAKYKRR
ncbi:hypothetical protein GLOTRDRAFT_35556 [Gloeophyllum trabeum ATCC 11539]|uniref:Autophagy-related protein 2 n=1 Tax=Gloeophyllum trabeum (strain ATCC 11539 / FP-39264 / Madison 617) TaxID=670483 RepID=S7QFB2_GLOTA|nr:uncharacterized protein GLOTRDRAFT_35556 [Gloeophyllum trabeum ATCC 11539]EPQ58082.1 hypothetical protein GLOTRDRAFT_35556 [Gloeophyllum trabeum ATCC 11539]